MINRETVRDALTSLLTTALVGTGKPCQAVYGYQVADFQGLTPVVAVSSAGSAHPHMTHQGNRATLYFNIYIFVLYSDANTGWTEADAEDRLDLIEKTIAETLEANRRYDGYWQGIDFADRSQVDSVPAGIGGDEYRREIIPVVVEVF